MQAGRLGVGSRQQAVGGERWEASDWWRHYPMGGSRQVVIGMCWADTTRRGRQCWPG